MFYCNICGGPYLSREQDLIEKPLPKIENHIATLWNAESILVVGASQDRLN